MKIYFMRHSNAEEFNYESHRSDADRNLTSKGIEKAKWVSKGLKKIGVDVDVVVSSPYNRAYQTAEIFHDIVGSKFGMEFSENIVPEASIRDFKSDLYEYLENKKSCIFITHQPFMGSCVSHLISEGKDSYLPIGVPKAGVCCMIAEGIEGGAKPNFILKWHMGPEEFKNLL